MFIKILQILLEKTCVGLLFLINFIKKRLRHGCFTVKFLKILRTTVLKNIHLWTTVSENNSRGAIELHLKVFAFQWIYIYLWAFQISYSGQCIAAWYTSTNHDQCIFIMYDSVGRKRTKQFSTSIKISWTKLHFYNLIWLAYFYK